MDSSRRAWLFRTLAIVSATWITTYSVRGGADENKLEQHRRRRRARGPSDDVIIGRIVKVDRDAVILNVRGFELGRMGLSEGDSLAISVGDESFFARLFTSKYYYEVLMRDTDRPRADLDFDVACIVEGFDTSNRVIVRGLAGGFGEWLRQRLGSSIRIARSG